MDKTIYPLTIKAGETATLNVSDTPKVTDTLIELFKIDMETQKDNPQGNASLAGAEFTWKYYAGFYNKDNLPAKATRTWVGRISELGYGMLFGSDVKKQFFQKRIKGRGYCDVGTSVISEFYTPLVYRAMARVLKVKILVYFIKGLLAARNSSRNSCGILSPYFSFTNDNFRGDFV